MKLHEDKFAFLNIINLIHEDSSIRADILEKDYYVTLLLRELAGKQVTLPAYFKGGTALYKAQKSIRRFSEDIDLTVCIDNCSNSQAKKRLEMATKKYQALPRTSRKDLEDDRKGSITNNTQHDTTKKRSHKSGSSCYFRGMRGYISISKSSGFRRLPGTAIFL